MRPPEPNPNRPTFQLSFPDTTPNYRDDDSDDSSDFQGSEDEKTESEKENDGEEEAEWKTMTNPRLKLVFDVEYPFDEEYIGLE